MSDWGFDRAQAQYDAAVPAYLEDEDAWGRWRRDDEPDPDAERDRILDEE